MDKYFLVQIKRTNGNIEKGIAVKDSLEDAEQGFHAYLSAYGFGHDEKTDYVQAGVLNGAGLHRSQSQNRRHNMLNTSKIKAFRIFGGGYSTTRKEASVRFVSETSERGSEAR